MRAELPVVKDVDAASIPPATRSLIVWGDPDSNSALASLIGDNQVPLQFEERTWTVGKTSFDGNHFAPALIYPRPDLANRPSGYLVLNSGLTFREGHDRTNSLQNPKLPDWAIIDITQPPDALAPGRIHDAGFFDEQWQFKQPPKAP
jgi:hypothetical protein